MKFSIKNFFSKCDQIRSKLWIWPHLLKKSLTEKFIFCAVREKAPSNKTQALTKSKNVEICLVCTSSKLFIRDSYFEAKVLKNIVVTGKTLFFVIGSFCAPHSVCLNIDLRFQS